MRLSLALAGVLALAIAPSALAQGTITATGSGQSAVSPQDRKDNASIAKAVADAYAAALPKAIADAREDATALAQAAGLPLGALQSVSDGATTGTPYFFPFGSSQVLGTFGPGKFCGNVHIPVFHTTKSGRRVVTGHHTRRTCRVPSSITRTVTLTFATG
jgi:Protein of unknown function (DUF541)